MFSLRMLFWLGFWRPTTPLSAFKYIIYTSYTVSMIISCILHLGSEFLALVFFVFDLKTATIIVCVMLTGIGAIVKMVNLTTRRSLIVGILEHRSEFLQYHTEKHPIVEANIKHEKRLTTMMFAFWMVTTTFWVLLPLLKFIGGGLPGLPFVAWWPLDVSIPMNWILAYIFQVVTGLLIVAFVSTADCLCVGMMITLVTEFKILRENLTAIADEPHRSKIKTSETDILALSEHKFLSLDSAEERLAQCVAHHQLIIRMADRIQAVFSPVLLVQFMASSLIICMVGFQATLSSVDTPVLLKCLMYLGAATLQLLLFCKYGDDVVEQSVLVQEAAYNSQWFNCQENVKHSLVMVIMRAQRPVALSAAGFYTVTLETFAKLLNASYTYFALLQQLNE